MRGPADLLPLAARLRRRFPGFREIEAIADETVELAPADEIWSSAAIALPGEIDRAISALEGSNMAEQRGWSLAGLRPHGATIAFRLDGATMFGTSIYAHGSFRQYGLRGPLIAGGRRRSCGEAQFSGGQGGEFYFGHWLCDSLATELLAEQRGLESVVFPRRWMHEPGYRELADITSSEISYARFDRLWVITDSGYNAARVQRFRTLRDRVRAHVTPGGRGRPLYVARGRTGAQRNLVNEDAVVTALTRRGIATIEPEKMTPAEIAANIGAADLIVSVEGSALCHGLIALPEGARILAIEPPDRFNIFNKIIGDFAGLRFGFTVAEPHADGFAADIDRLLRTLDLVQQA